MLITVIKTIFNCIWIMLKPCLWFLIPLILAFCISFYVAYKRKVKTGTAQREVIGHINPNTDVSIFTKLFVQLPRQFWENHYNKKVGAFDEHGIIMYTGKQGQGKTLTMTRDILRLQFKYPDLNVCTNYGLNSENEQLDDWRKLVDYNNGEHGVLAAIDECQNWFSSKISKDFPPRMLATVTQNRKNRRVIMMTSHFFTNVSKPIRLHCTEVRACRTFLKCFTIVSRYEPIMDGDGNVKKMRRLGHYCFVHSNELYSAYDTYRVIKNLSEAGFSSDTWVDDNDDTFSTSRAPIGKARGRRRHNVEQEVMRTFDDCYRLMEGK
ncbi:MAG: hypothetical protein ACI4IK_00120 [Eubacterium sp.]